MNNIKSLKLTSFILVSLFFIACGGDDCTQADWIGTFNVDRSTESCEDENAELVEQFVITAGSSDNAINIDGEEISISGCSASYTILGITFTFEIEGNSLIVEGFGCSGTYIRQ